MTGRPIPPCSHGAVIATALLVFGAFPALALGGARETGDAEGAQEQGRVLIEGAVLLPDGRPARGAVVVSSAGGSAGVGGDGAFALEIGVDPSALAVELTAVANGHGGALIARRTLDGLRDGAARHAGTLILAQSEGCVSDWIPEFGPKPGTNSSVLALTVFDDGSGAGPALYAGGYFTSAGGQSAARIARWDGESWSALGSGMNDTVFALAVCDDGSGAGPALYAGGAFTSAGGQSAARIARWDGQSWSALASGMDGAVRALSVFDAGSGAGPALHAGGDFTHAGGESAGRIARWDGRGWSALAGGMNGSVRALGVFDAGFSAGPALCAGGEFTLAGGQGASHIARWDGQSWSALGGGINGPVNALSVFDDGSGAGPALCAGGDFTAAGGQAAGHIARWDGETWSALAGGVNATVFALAAFDDGSGAGPALYAGGFFTLAGGQPVQRSAKWDGQGWSPLGSEMDEYVYALAGFDDGSGAGAALYAGLGGGDGIARWDGELWSALSDGLNLSVSALAVFDDGAGAGPALCAGGDFTQAGGQVANRIARWDGQSWSALGTGMNFEVKALAVFDDGSGAGPSLVAGGLFTSAGGQPAKRIAKWDGQTWSALGNGMDSAVSALAVFDDGSGAGPALYAGGMFSTAGGLDARSIARWDGQAWSQVGGGMVTPFLASSVRALAVFDDGTGAGPALYAGGQFLTAGAGVVHNIARWDGETWSALGSGVDGAVHALAVFDDGSGAGPALYAGGGFNTAGGQSASKLAKWNGLSWSALGGATNNQVFALSVFDAGSGAGPALFAGGTFTTVGGLSANRIARWDGQSWSALGSGMEQQVWALLGFDDGSGAGPALNAGGLFTASPGGDGYLARWGCPTIEAQPGCFGNPALLASLSSKAAIGGTFKVSLSSSHLMSGLGLLFFGLDGTDVAGCGLFVPGFGELLLALAPPPKQVGSAPLSAGAAGFTLPVPNDPSAVGVELAFHGAVVGLLDPGTPIELSNGLRVKITQ